MVADTHSNALYFSRSAIPYNRDNKGSVVYFKHIGIYGYDRRFLFKYIELPPTSLELVEQLEQLSALENGYIIKMVETEMNFIGVNRPEDIARVEMEML